MGSRAGRGADGPFQSCQLVNPPVETCALIGPPGQQTTQCFYHYRNCGFGYDGDLDPDRVARFYERRGTESDPPFEEDGDRHCYQGEEFDPELTTPDTSEFGYHRFGILLPAGAEDGPSNDNDTEIVDLSENLQLCFGSCEAQGGEIVDCTRHGLLGFQSTSAPMQGALDCAMDWIAEVEEHWGGNQYDAPQCLDNIPPPEGLSGSPPPCTGGGSP